jgi:hypothetical protein
LYELEFCSAQTDTRFPESISVSDAETLIIRRA